MAYLGGKSKNSQHIINILNNSYFDGMDYFEPFLGYAHILRRVENKKTYSASDANELLITLLQGIKLNKKFHSFLKKNITNLGAKKEKIHLNERLPALLILIMEKFGEDIL